MRRFARHQYISLVEGAIKPGGVVQEALMEEEEFAGLEASSEGECCSTALLYHIVTGPDLVI